MRERERKKYLEHLSVCHIISICYFASHTHANILLLLKWNWFASEFWRKHGCCPQTVVWSMVLTLCRKSMWLKKEIYRFFATVSDRSRHHRCQQPKQTVPVSEETCWEVQSTGKIQKKASRLTGAYQRSTWETLVIIHIPFFLHVMKFSCPFVFVWHRLQRKVCCSSAHQLTSQHIMIASWSRYQYNRICLINSGWCLNFFMNLCFFLFAFCVLHGFT